MTPADRFWSKVQGGDVDSCWEWTASTTRGGYGAFNSVAFRSRQAHRAAYEMLRAEIPEGLELDHLCRNRICVNPWHLEPVSRLENVRRGQGHGSETSCPQGHDYDEANTYVAARGDRQCRTCTYARNRRYTAERKAA